ncbi:hypothetical protein GOARA_056_02110 [Gordonia araii NBRC 100433]|uniref:Uncharacterized protein n=1 Tax=Gordonia araii NBRC 100433 TaxID=1073574 RepID=G7H3N8_9ACTN|nr:hypothetical protein [Gordonia araii]GAB10463.1 hypothetical protein GOARA_056_02110 [Gordonia araii NBRC 100433]
MADLKDEQIISALNGMIAAINPIIDVLSETDVTGLRGKSHQDKPKDDSIFRRVEHIAAKTVDLTALPGTKRWEELSMGERAQWWVNRIGSLNTVGVAFPNIFGLWARRLPITTVLGFVNQAMVLIAVAREYRVTDRARQIELLASVLGGRELTLHNLTEVPDAAPVDAKRKSLIKATWDIARTLQGGVDEMGKRPQPAKPLRWLSNVPVIGAPINYVGERFALKRAVNAGRAWIVAHPDAITRGGLKASADGSFSADTAPSTSADGPTATDAAPKALLSPTTTPAPVAPTKTTDGTSAAKKAPAKKTASKKAPAKKAAPKTAAKKTPTKKAAAKKNPAKKSPAKKAAPKPPSTPADD